MLFPHDNDEFGKMSQLNFEIKIFFILCLSAIVYYIVYTSYVQYSSKEYQ